MEEEYDSELVEEVAEDLTGNLKRIHEHGTRANRIITDMLRMGRGGGEWQPTDLNVLLNQHALLAFHSARATDPCLLYTSPSPRDRTRSRMPSSA